MDKEIVDGFVLVSKVLKDQVLFNTELSERIDILEQQQIRILQILSGNIILSGK